MLTILDHTSLAWNRACKTRASLHLALTRAAKPIVDAALHRDIQHANTINVELVRQLDLVLDRLGRTPGHTQP